MALNEIDTMRNTFITCPYCGYVDHDSWEWAGAKGDTNGEIEYECPSCEKTFILQEPEIEIYYTTKAKL